MLLVVAYPVLLILIPEELWIFAIFYARWVLLFILIVITILRRLNDMSASRFMIILAFVPGPNFLFFLFLAIFPGRSTNLTKTSLIVNLAIM